MKHKRKRLLCFLAALAVTAGPVQELRLPAMLPAVSAEAAEPEETVTRSGITYAVYADHAEVTKLAPNVIDANIEAEVSGKPVTVNVRAVTETQNREGITCKGAFNKDGVCLDKLPVL